MKRTIALVTGGFTGESVISFKSADFVDNNLNKEKFDVFKITVANDGWFYTDKNEKRIDVDKNDFSINLGDERVTFDGVFLMLHGSPGEDGKLQGYFDMLGIPYSTCDALTSSITMNKGYTKAVVAQIEDLFVAKSLQLFSHTSHDIDHIRQSLKLPLFIKPNNGGSSIGMSKVKTWEELSEALDKAFAEDTQVLVEEFIDGREFSVGVYNGYNGVQVLPATEVISSKEFFDFEAKYTPGVTEEITPGRMNAEEVSRVNRIVAEVYKVLNCRGMVRVDYFLEKETGNFYFVEINTIPGQTGTSFIPQQVRAAGLDIKDFYTEVLEVAIGR